MARPPTITRERLVPLIRARGPVSATELAASLGVDRTTIGRTLHDFGEELVTLGATRSTRYLLRRDVRNIGNRWPIYRIDESGRAREWAELEAFHDRAWRIHWADEAPAWAEHFTLDNGLWSGFPFFLQDIRPQGFLGRIIAQRLTRTLQVPEDPRVWDDEDTLTFLEADGEDLPGNLVVGDDCLRRALAIGADTSETPTIRDSDRAETFAVRAREIAQTLPGSSAGGEQPKFLTRLREQDGSTRSVLVKFSPPMDQQTGQRWADLLTCEFHAHQVLAEAGLTNPGARLLDADGRRFLEVPRFDRQGPGGRRGVVSLEALATSILGRLPRDWTSAADELLRHEIIDSDTVATIRILQAFGELIGNSDMHLGNLAFFLGDTLPLALTPTYDMLPMLWAPGPQGEIVERRFAPAPPIPSMEHPWREAATLAQTFWQQIATDDHLSPAFVRTANESSETIRALRQHLD